MQAQICPVRQFAEFGGYGSGKSRALMERLIAQVGINGSENRRKNISQPRCALISPTYKILMQSTMSTFYQVCPPEWIRTVRSHPTPYVEFVNDVVMELHSGGSELEGSNYFGIFVDEAAHRKYSERILTNYIARVRDPEATFLSQTFVGLPLAGHAQDLFDRPPRPMTAKDGGHWTVMVPTSANPHIDEQTLNAMLESVPNEEGKKILSGQWHSPLGHMFPEFSDEADGNMVDAKGRPGDVTHIGWDPGPLAAVCFAQPVQILAMIPDLKTGMGPLRPYRDWGLLVVDQLTPEGQGVEATCKLIKKRPWRVGEGSTIAIDPSASVSSDDRRTIRRYFPGARVVQADSTAGSAERRVSRTRAALKDANGVRRLQVSRVLSGAGARRGVVEVLKTDHRKENGTLAQDNWLEHMRDALGYVVEKMLPRRRWPT